jgi:hypothetical protein
MIPCPDFKGWEFGIRITGENVHCHLLLRGRGSSSEGAKKFACAADVVYNHTRGVTLVDNEITATGAPTDLNNTLPSNTSLYIV